MRVETYKKAHAIINQYATFEVPKEDWDTMKLAGFDDTTTIDKLIITGEVKCLDYEIDIVDILSVHEEDTVVDA